MPLSGQMGVTEAVVYDLFCGPGFDAHGVKGSPIRASDVVKKSAGLVLNSQVPLRLVFNDFESDYVTALKSKLGRSVCANDGKQLATIEYFVEPFQLLFPKLLPKMGDKTANFLFIDQFGATNVNADVFRSLHSLAHTDVLFFLTSDWFRRFADSPEAANWGISKEEIMDVNYNEIHRFIADYFHELVGHDYLVSPFSLKKGGNIYGLIFASHHHLGLKKFLEIAWKEDPHYGEANFDLYEEGVGGDQMVMFEVRKVEDFQSDLKIRILAKEFASDSDIYLFMLQRGFINRHAKPVVSEMAAKNVGIIEFQSNGIRQRPRLSPASVKDPRALVFRS